MTVHFKPCPNGVLLAVRVTPKSARDVVDGAVERNGEVRLIVRVRAAPEDGKANAAVVKTIAASLGVKRASVSVVSGLKDRDKSLLIEGGVEYLTALVSDWLHEVCRDGKNH